jgi:hypothetical protein
LAQLGKINAPMAMKLAKPLENERSSKMLSGVAALYARNGTAEQFPFYERILTTNAVGAYDAIGALNAFTFYVSQQDLALERKSVKVFEYQAKNGGTYVKMFLPGCMNYLNKNLETKIESFKDEEAKAKTAGNANGAEMARSKQAEAQALISTFKAISASVEKDDKSH